MQTESKFFDDVARLLTGAAGAAQGAAKEFETVIRSQLERWMSEMDLVSREEFDAMRELAVRAREETEQLKDRVAALESQLETAGQKTDP